MSATSLPLLIKRRHFEEFCGAGTIIQRLDAEEEPVLQVCLRHQSRRNRIIDWSVAEIHTPGFPVRHLCKRCAIDLGIVGDKEINYSALVEAA